MMLDYLGEAQAAAAIGQSVIDLLRSGRLKGVGTGMHATDEVGDLVVGQPKAATAKV